jgi:hypothetical protein
VAAQSDGPEPVVSVRSVRRIAFGLFAVSIRTQTGRLYTVVIAEDLASSGIVAMAALAVATLADTGQLPT